MKGDGVMIKLLPLFLLLITGSEILAAEPEAGSPSATVEAFHEALAAEDKGTALGLLAPTVIIYESGGAEQSRDEYASHHLGADCEFSKATTRKIVDQQIDRASDLALVLTRTETNGRFRGKELDLAGTETMLLRKTEDGWRIVHIHWSSRAK
jgi:ketosteroid isomerase-like protein